MVTTDIVAVIGRAQMGWSLLDQCFGATVPIASFWITMITLCLLGTCTKPLGPGATLQNQWDLVQKSWSINKRGTIGVHSMRMHTWYTLIIQLIWHYITPPPHHHPLHATNLWITHQFVYSHAFNDAPINGFCFPKVSRYAHEGFLF